MISYRLPVLGAIGVIVALIRDWIAKNAGNTGAAPAVSEGIVMLHLK
jgi:hypothetical protein